MKKQVSWIIVLIVFFWSSYAELPPEPPQIPSTTQIDVVQQTTPSEEGSTSSSKYSSSSHSSSGSFYLPEKITLLEESVQEITPVIQDAEKEIDQEIIEKPSSSIQEKLLGPIEEKPEAISTSNGFMPFILLIFAVMLVIFTLFLVFKKSTNTTKIATVEEAYNSNVETLRNYFSENISKGYDMKQLISCAVQRGYSENEINEAQRYLL